jgi:hypothetical protein
MPMDPHDPSRPLERRAASESARSRGTGMQLAVTVTIQGNEIAGD